MKRKVCVSLLGLILSTVLGNGVILAQETPAPNALYLQVIQKLEQLQPSQDIEVLIGTEKDEYNVDEPMEFRFQASHDCYMVMMDIAAAQYTEDNQIKYGDITFLVPNALLKEAKIQAGRVYSTLYDFNLPIKVAAPSGYDTVNIFCSSQPITLFEMDFQGQIAYVITPENDEKLHRLLTHLELLEQQQWAGNSVSFLIHDQTGNTRGVPKKFGAMPPIGATGTTGKGGKFFPPIGATGTTGQQK